MGRLVTCHTSMEKLPIHTRVKVVALSDETALPEYLGKEGVIVSHNANGQTGNYEHCPLHEVSFDDGSKNETFWAEELAVIN